MDEKPVDALRKKRDNSISRCWGLMAAGEVKAVVSAGNTGAMVASALFNAKMFLPGVRRPGIAAIFPSHQGPIVIIDVGSNMNAKAEDLYQYGIMGSIYAETILGVTNPHIGLLNVGTEDEKGNELTRATRALYQKSPWAARFVGNIEGRDIYSGRAGRHLRRVCRQRLAQGRRRGGRISVLDAQGRACPAHADPARRRRAQDRRQLETAQDPLRVRGIRRRPPAGHPRRVHYLPRLVRRSCDQKRTASRRDDGQRPSHQAHRRTTRGGPTGGVKRCRG